MHATPRGARTSSARIRASPGAVIGIIIPVVLLDGFVVLGLPPFLRQVAVARGADWHGLFQPTAQKDAGPMTSRNDQTMARLGGDEFAIMATSFSDPTQAGRIAERVVEAMRTENENASTPIALISTSIGVAVFPTDAADRMSSMSHTDTALYRAKAEGRERTASSRAQCADRSATAVSTCCRAMSKAAAAHG